MERRKRKIEESKLYILRRKGIEICTDLGETESECIGGATAMTVKHVSKNPSVNKRE